MIRSLKLGAVLSAALLTGTVLAQGNIPLYKQAAAPIDQRVADLLARMTLEEKVAQLQANSTFPAPPEPTGPVPASGIIKNGQVDETIARRTMGNGLGAFVNLGSGFNGLNVLGSAQQANLIQSWVMKNTRLGIPVLLQSEALHGAVMEGSTSFPQAVALGSTWDPALIRQAFSTAAREARASGVSMVLAPVLDLARDPRFGRVEEMYSEDPYLVGEMAVAAIQGLQGTGPTIDQNHVLAMAKHFVHGQPENGTNIGPNDVSERTMREVFLPPFEKAIKRANLASIMPSYNENDGGIPSHVNSWLLRDVLRKEWGFTGMTGSDWFAVSQLYKEHGVASGPADAAVQALNAGLNMEAPVGTAFSTLGEAVKLGKVSQATLDEAVGRVLTLKFRAGLFDRPLTDTAQTQRVLADKNSAVLARKVADEAIVLLKNQDKLLPLDPAKAQNIAVIGPNADKMRLGGYSGKPAYFVSVLEGIRRRVGKKATVTYAEGVRISEPDKNPIMNKIMPFQAPSPEKDAELIAQAVETARTADVVILVLGENETISREALGDVIPPKPSLGDADDLELPGRQNELVREVAKLGKPIVAVLLNGRALSAEYLNQTAPAIVEGWYLGQETGNAVAGVLFGDVNPSGKLPVTVARSVGQLPAYYYHTPKARLGYVYRENSPLYPFGFGLSYTSFSYGKPTLDRPRIKADGTATVSVSVTNSGDRAGDEIVQMYVHPKVSSVAQPVQRLAGFERIHLKKGETKVVRFPVSQEQLAILNREMKHVVEPGIFELSVGTNVQKLDKVELTVDPQGN